MLEATDYLLNVTAMAMMVGALALGATRVRSRLLNGWGGLPAHLADAVLTLALLIWVAELIGAVEMLERGPLVAACLVVGLGLRFTVRPPDPGSGQAPPVPPSGHWGGRVAALIAVVLVAHWSIGTVAAFGSGMTGYDSVWYHMPFSANFAQTGSTVDFAFASPRYLSWFYPQNSELLHGVGMVVFQRDILSPLFNLLALGGCLAAAWCVGRPYGRGPWTLAATAVLLDAGLMADQAGEARNDTFALFLLTAAVAFLVNGAAVGARRTPMLGALAAAGVAAGLAAGTKLSFLVPVAVLAIGVPFLAAGKRRAAALWFGLPMLAGCAFWYLRNIAVTGNPLPWFKAIGPLQLGGPDQGLGGRPQFSVLDYVGDGGVWSDWLEPALSNRLGELWPLLVAAAVGALAVSLLRGPGILKLIALAAIAWIPVYLLDGTSAEGPAGSPVGFASSLRHLLPSLGLALILLPLLPGVGSRKGRIGCTVVLTLLLVVADFSGEPWRPEYVLLAAILAGLTLLAFALWERGLAEGGFAWPTRRILLTGVTIVLAAVIGGGWFLQRSYLNERYTGDEFRSDGLNAAFAWASMQQEKRIATTFPLHYPLYGPDLSNQVDFLGHELDDGGFVQPTSCPSWLRAINRGHFDYLVINIRQGVVDRDDPADLRRLPVRQVFERKLIEVFRVEGPLGRSACTRIRERRKPPGGRARSSRDRT